MQVKVKNLSLGGKNNSHLKNLSNLSLGKFDLFGKNALSMHDSYDLNMLICMKKLWS